MHKLISLVLASMLVLSVGAGSALALSPFVELGADASFSLTKKEAATISLDAESAELGAESVSTSEDLSLFVTSRMKRDMNIERVDASGDEIQLTYRQKAHFLGFISGSIRATAAVSSDGHVDVDYPWYRFLFAIEGGNSAQANLETRVSELMEGADVSAGFTAQLEAELIEAMHVALSGDAA